MAKIFVTRKIPEIGLTMLRDAGHEVVVSEKDGVLTKEELHAAVSEQPYDALLTLLSDPVDDELLSHAPNVKIVSNYAVGYNNINVPAMTERNVMVTNTPDVLNDSVAEFTLALIFAITKRIPEAERFARAGKYEGWAPELLLGVDLVGKKLGIVGAGRIGATVAERAQKGLGMDIIYHDIKPSEKLESMVTCSYCATLEELLQQADVVTLHVPLLDATRHLMNAERLAQMKPTAYLVNTSRGPVVDEAALAEALANQTIAGAAIDVFEFEPAITESLKSLENVVITPHIASATTETRDKMAVLAAQAIIDCMEGKTPEHVVKG